MLADFWAGYISGAVGIVVGNPLDLIKVRVQAGSPSLPALSPVEAPLIPREQPLASSRLGRLSAKEFFRGLPAPILTYGALNAVLFATYNRSLLLTSSLTPAPGSSMDVPGSQETRYPYWSHFAAGFIAGITTFIISAPTEVVKCRAQAWQDVTGGSTPISSWSIARTLYQDQGIRGLYHGGVITSIRDSVGYGFYFLTYEGTKDLWNVIGRSGGLLGRSEERTLLDTIAGNEPLKILLCGGLAGVVSWASIFPLDVVKTRVQLSSNTSAWSVARRAYETEGARIFFKGATYCLVRAFLVNAVQWTVYERGLAFLTSTN